MITFENVNKTYPNGTTAALDVSFTVPAGSTVALLGPSGAGKTTLLRMVNRLVDPDSGRITVGDRDISQINPVTLRRSIGYVLQEGGLLPHKRVLDNVALVARLNGASKADARERAQRMLTLVGLDAELGSRFPHQLSGGQQQRVGVARALVGEADVMLMDEPFGAVDPMIRRELQAQTRRLQSELGKTVLLVTHDVDEAFSLADQIVVLRTGGSVAQYATPEELLTNPADDFVADLLGLSDGARDLHVVDRGGRALVTDGSGRFIGRVRA
ncbi:ABC transporter ATP-binding protein [Jonesia quinghaiensis]|uniref:ABC transporter ATP-binding protein n=1 Tax=Jonesia quinghaiensis TaxID=262806 RepID=UPI0004094DA1|nr:ATP-binding cassette domain-containing protein [Jonesia quinghaiensis]